MPRTPTRRALCLSLLLLSAVPAVTADPPKKPTEEEIKNGQDRVTAQLEKLKAPGAQVQYLDEEVVRRALPGRLCYAVLFRQYPVARLAPEPLKAGNVFVVGKEEKPEVLSDERALEKFLATNLPPVKDDAVARDAVQTWLRLSEELHQDGFFRFTIPDKELTVAPEKDGRKVTGKAVVEPKGGDKGEIAVTLIFGGDGKLIRAEEKADLKAGVRPICQATKLLDPDLIVRRMAEKDILVMGQRARTYLMEQRAKAAPELQQAIDRIWQRIIDEGW